jgi:polysaccharide transporter, PST family
MIVKNIAYLYAIQLLRLFLPLALLSILTKLLTSEQYSVYVYSLACTTWLSMLIEYGFNVSATRRIANDSESIGARGIILQTQSARILLTSVSLIFLFWSIFGSKIFSTFPEWAISAWLMGVMTGLTPTYYFQAVSRLRLVAILEMGGGLLSFSVVLFLIHGPNEFWRLCAVLVLTRLIIWQVLERKMFKEHSLRWKDSLLIWQGWIALKDGWKLFLVQAAASIYTSFNIILLGGVSSVYAVAVYGSSERLIRAGVTFIGQATSAIFPKLNELKATDPTGLLRARRLSLTIFSIAGFLCIPLIWLLAPILSDTLFHGTLPEMTATLRVMAWVVPAVAISNVIAIHYLVVDHKEYIVNHVVFAAVPISLMAGFALSREYGAVGMAIAWVAIEWFVVIGLAAAFYRNHQHKKLIT